MDFMVKGKITEADTPTIWLGATPYGLISNPPPSSIYFYTGCHSWCNPPIYPGLGQAPNMLACTQWFGYSHHIHKTNMKANNVKILILYMLVIYTYIN